jgi:uncharacterized protein
MSQPTIAPKREPNLSEPSLLDAVIEHDTSAPRRFRIVASDESVDRYGDIIRAAGWQLDNFRKNPVLLYGHQSRNLPVGKVDPIGIEGTRLIAHGEFVPEGVDPFADSVAAMFKGGFLNASSVGFMPLKKPNAIWAADDPEHEKWPTGYEYTSHELLELSIVPVPANPNALALARSFSLSEEDTRRLFKNDAGLNPARIAAEQRSHRITLARLRRPF